MTNFKERGDDHSPTTYDHNDHNDHNDHSPTTYDHNDHSPTTYDHNDHNDHNLHSEKPFRNIIKSNRNQIVYTIFQINRKIARTI